MPPTPTLPQIVSRLFTGHPVPTRSLTAPLQPLLLGSRHGVVRTPSVKSCGALAPRGQGTEHSCSSHRGDASGAEPPRPQDCGDGECGLCTESESGSTLLAFLQALWLQCGQLLRAQPSRLG